MVIAFREGGHFHPTGLGGCGLTGRCFMFQRFHVCSLGSLTNDEILDPKESLKSWETHSKGGSKC